MGKLDMCSELSEFVNENISYSKYMFELKNALLYFKELKINNEKDEEKKQDLMALFHEMMKEINSQV